MNISQSLFFSVFLAFLLGNFAFAADCQNCAKLQNAKDTQAKYLAQTKKYISMNEAFLAKLDPSESSKITKVRSNIIVGNIQSETIQNRILAHDQDLLKNDCASCGGT